MDLISESLVEWASATHRFADAAYMIWNVVSMVTWKQQENTFFFAVKNILRTFCLNCCTHLSSCMGCVGSPHWNQFGCSWGTPNCCWKKMTTLNSSNQPGSGSLRSLWFASFSSFSFCSQFGTATRKKQISCWWCWFASKSTGWEEIGNWVNIWRMFFVCRFF